MEQIYTQIRQYIDENRQPMLNLWRDLVNTESGTTHPCPRHSKLR